VAELDVLEHPFNKIRHSKVITVHLMGVFLYCVIIKILLLFWLTEVPAVSVNDLL